MSANMGPVDANSVGRHLRHEHGESVEGSLEAPAVLLRDHDRIHEMLSGVGHSHCPQCGGPGPSHDGSSRCESGSIASGGTRAHCSCDRCY